jgi:hypothetical protein
MKIEDRPKGYTDGPFLLVYDNKANRPGDNKRTDYRCYPIDDLEIQSITLEAVSVKIDWHNLITLLRNKRAEMELEVEKLKSSTRK